MVPLVGAVALVKGVTSLFGGKTPVPVAIGRVQESLFAAAQANDSRRLLVISQGGTIDLPYQNSGGAGWSTPINWSDSKPERADERAYAGTLYASLTGRAGAAPTGAQIPSLSGTAARVDAQGASVLSAAQSALTAAIAAGRTDILRSVNAAETNNTRDTQAQAAQQRSALATPFIIIAAIVLVLFMAKK